MKADAKQLRIVFENASVGMALVGLDPRCLVFNRALAEMLGYPENELAAKKLDDVVHASDREEVRATFERLVRGESKRAQLELRLLREDGEMVWARVTGSTFLDERDRPVFVVGSAEDIGEHKRTEGAAIAARESMQRLIETTDAIVVQLSAAGEIRFVNRAFEEITGYTREDLEDKNWFETLVPRDRYPEVWEEFQRLTTGGTAGRFENPILTKSGEERHIVWRNSNLRLGDEIVGTVSIGIDISERKRAEEALKDSEEKMLALFTSSPVGLAVSDASGEIYDVNEEFERLFECRHDEVVGKTSIELGFWADPKDRERVIGLVEENGRIKNLEVEMRSQKGTAMTMRLDVHVVTVGGFSYQLSALTDITERKRAEEQIALLKHAIDVHSDGAYWMDGENRFFYLNDAACKAVGYEREELIGKPVSFINPRATPEALKAVWEHLRSDGFFFTESVHRRKDGSEFPVEIMSTYVQFGGKEYNCGDARDISERKQQERDRAQLAEQLVQAQKMEAVGRLAGGVAHNFNNILTALIGYCELLLAKLPEGADGRQEAEQIKLAADRAAAVTRELLLFGRREAGRRIKLDLNEVVVQTRLLLHELIRGDIQIITALAPVVAPVKANRSQMQQMLVNLVLNASDAMPDGGVVAIDTADLDIDEQLIEGGVVVDPGHYVRLTVKDTGIGMDEETQARIFEPFFSTKGPERRSGLGLATAYGIVEESGGKITVDSKPNEGTKFTIYLPALSGQS